MGQTFDRRQFLKWTAGLLSSLALLPNQREAGNSRRASDPAAPNVLVLVFDALSAQDVSLLGYHRQTTPNLAQLAEKAVVYHRHHTAGTFTTPGTTSLLSGTYPWTHWAVHLYQSIPSSVAHKSAFRAFADGGYHTIAYSHNIHTTVLLHELRHDLSEFVPTRQLCLLDGELSDRLFAKDYGLAVWRERLFQGAGDNPPSSPTSLLMHLVSRMSWSIAREGLQAAYQDQFPRGLPTFNDQVFVLENAIDWLIDRLNDMPRPFMAYLHFLPPHEPYNPRREFVGVFNDGWQFRRKSRRFFSEEGSDEYLDSRRREYDEYIAYADAELGRLYRSIARRGLLDDTYLVVTTDHGEMFERGIGGHLTPTMYDPLVRVPLVICAPGQEQREDVHTPTSSIDVLPTLLHITGQPIPEWCEGQVMPPFTDQPTRDGRSTYVVDAKSNARQGPLTRATVALIKGPYKLVHYFGYRQHPDDYELYNVANDPEEMEDLYPSQVALARELREELSVRIQKANEPYLTGRR